jgi:putative transposase
MAPRKRQRLTPTDDWRLLQQQFHWPEQRSYELVRPVVLFGLPTAERAQQTGVSTRTIARTASLFEAEGMASFLLATSRRRGRPSSPELQAAILALRAEYPALRPYQIGTICFVRFGQRPSVSTIARTLTRYPVEPVPRRYPPYAAITDGSQRRLAVIRLHAEGWTVSAIAGSLEVSRRTISAVLRRWRDEDFAGLPDRSHARQRRPRKTDLHAMNLARQLQVNPEMGEFRLHTKLQRLGIDLSPRTCGRILAVNRALYGVGRPPRSKPTFPPKPMPFAATSRHQYWSVDIRYLDHHLGGGNIYCISILDNYSRALLAGGVFRSQDTPTFLLVLRAAITTYGSPDTLVSDSGGVFLAKQAQAVYAALGMQKVEIDRGKPWQDYTETHFTIQRRMADWAFARAQTWAELVALHARWMADYNVEAHWAHRQRKDGRRSPEEVLGWVLGTVHEPAALERAFQPVRQSRVLDRSGYAHYRRWRVYGERGLARQKTALWLAADGLTIAYADEPLAQYVVHFGRRRKEVRRINVLRLFETRHRSPQPWLWELGPDEWLAVLRLPVRPFRHRRHSRGVQGRLLPPAADQGPS